MVLKTKLYQIIRTPTEIFQISLPKFGYPWMQGDPLRKNLALFQKSHTLELHRSGKGVY